MSRIQSRSLLDVTSCRDTEPNTTRLVSGEFCPRKSSSRRFRIAVASLRALRIAGQSEPREDSSWSSRAPLSDMKYGLCILRRRELGLPPPVTVDTRLRSSQQWYQSSGL